MGTDHGNSSSSGLSTYTLALDNELRAGTMESLQELSCPGLEAEVLRGTDAIWVVVKRDGAAGLAVRAAHCPGGISGVTASRDGDAVRLSAESAVATHRVKIELHNDDLPLLSINHELRPRADLLVTHMPRDLYPLGRNLDPAASRGCVEAAQRGHNDAVCYFTYEEPNFGSVVYCQDLTSLNPYFAITETTPDGSAGGRWPEIGFLLPTPLQKGQPALAPLPKGQWITVNDAKIVFHHDGDRDECASARRFLQMKAAAYRRIQRPPVQFRDWESGARQTVRALESSPKATISHYGHRYVHPYTASEYPDIMVQSSILAALSDFEHWSGDRLPFRVETAAGLNKFFDRRLPSLRRYLPNVGKDKNKNAVDSWYLYHPLVNLGRLAIDGDPIAKRYFLRSLEFACKTARHFSYHWPIQFDVRDFSIIVAARNEDGLEQTDVGGLYAYVMLLAFHLCGEQRYLGEAKAAIDASRGMRFELAYQTNLTAWGAAACMRLWNVTDEGFYLRQAYVYLASFMHNCIIWNPQFRNARHYDMFFQPTCLHDAPYAAMYECFDAFVAIESCLKDSGSDLDEGVRMLLSEYCRYAVSNAWYYYPDALPEDALATDIRNGHIDRELPFPLEDLYPDGQPAGQVGQEIYGAGAALIFASRMFHHVEGAPFKLYCDHFLTASERTSPRSIILHLSGGETCEALLAIIPNGSARPRVQVHSGATELVGRSQAGRREFVVPARGSLRVTW